MKKITSIIISLILLLLPFGVLLNVKATAITFNLDNNTTNGQGKKVLNTTSVTVNDIGANNTLGMYKLLDVYYDSTSNQISYGFAGSFGTFANAQNPALTVNDYLTTDDTYSGNDLYYDNSDFNELVSDYAKYVRANNVSVTYTMTTSSSNGVYSATYANAEAGVYLVLPTSVTAQISTYEGHESNIVFEYSVMIANVIPTAGSNNTWDLDSVSITAKKNNPNLMAFLVEDEADNFMSAVAGNGTFGTSLNYKAGETYSYAVIPEHRSSPTNAHSSIKQLEQNYILSMGTIEFSSNLAPDVTDLNIFRGTYLAEGKIENNKLYFIDESGAEPEDVEVGNVTISSNSLTIEFTSGYYAAPVFNLLINSGSLSNAASGNTITATTYAVKDPYVDIGSNITRADIRAAFDTNDANYSSNKSVAIRRAIEKIEKTVTLYVTGVTVNNTNSSNNALAGGEFAVYESYSNGTYSNQLGSNIVMDSNGTGLLNGLDPTHTYYLKQVKAPSGYRLYDEKIIVLPGSNDSTVYDLSTYQVVSVSNGMYTANVVNQPMLALPFTGGSGTVIYTVIGLLIVVGAGIFLVLYKKKNKKKD